MDAHLYEQTHTEQNQRSHNSIVIELRTGYFLTVQ
jgi:hypothetical protein